MFVFQLIGRLILFSVFYLRALCVANIYIAIDVLTPGLKVRPGFLRIPLRTRSDAELLVFSNLITMTPGTLALDVSSDRKYVYVHALYATPVEETRRSIASDLQDQILGVFQ